MPTDLKTSKLFLFAPVVEGRDQNYNNLQRGDFFHFNSFAVLALFSCDYNYNITTHMINNSDQLKEDKV